jgi:hypothetical protein
MSTARKVAALERLAADPHAAPGEADNARRAAARLRARAPASGVRHPPPPPPAARVEARGGVYCWVGPPPTHGPECVQAYAPCPECAVIEAFRRWVRGQR